MLIQAKAQVGHGIWGAWVEETFGLDPKVANNYMRVARNWGRVGPMLEANRNPNSEMNLTKVLKALAEPRGMADDTGNGAAEPGVDDGLAIQDSVRSIGPAVWDPGTPPCGPISMRASGAKENAGDEAEGAALNGEPVQDGSVLAAQVVSTVNETPPPESGDPSVEDNSAEHRIDPEWVEAHIEGSEFHVPVESIEWVDGPEEAPQAASTPLHVDGAGENRKWDGVDDPEDVGLLHEFTGHLRAALGVLPRFHASRDGAQRDAGVVGVLWDEVGSLRERFTALLKSTSSRGLTRCVKCNGGGVIAGCPCTRCDGLGTVPVE